MASTRMMGVLVVLAVWITQGGNALEPGTPVNLESEMSKACYAFGLDMGRALADMSDELLFDVDVPAFLRGVEDAVRRRPVVLAAPAAREAKIAVVDRGKKARHALGERNRREGEAFLAANRLQDGITTLANGLQYAVVTDGDGPRPASEDTVKIRYRGALLDGTEFVNTLSAPEPQTAVAGTLLPGLWAVLAQMQPGAIVRAYVPPDLAYGSKGRGRAVGPHATLVFDVELVGVTRGEETTDLPAENKKECPTPGHEEPAID